MKNNRVKQFENIGEYVRRFGFNPDPVEEFFALRYEEVNDISDFYLKSFKNPFFEISLDLSEGCSFSVDNFNSTSGKNRMNIISPFRLQSIYSSQEQNSGPPKGYSIFFNSEFLGFHSENRSLANWLPLIGHNVSPILELSDYVIPEFIHLFEKILHHQRHPIADSKMIARHYINVLLLLIKSHCTGWNTGSLRKDSQLFTEFQLLLESNFLTFSVEQFADKLNLSRKHFSETIKQISGKTPIHIINEKKIDYAKSLLIHTNMSMKKIASELQFDDTNYFYTFFRRSTGTTPSKFRNK